MKNHGLTITMSKRETDFIKDCIDNDTIQNNEAYDWKFMFDDSTTAKLTINIREMKDPLVFLSVIGKDWEENRVRTADDFWGQYRFVHNDNCYTFTINPSKAEV